MMANLLSTEFLSRAKTLAAVVLIGAACLLPASRVSLHAAAPAAQYGEAWRSHTVFSRAVVGDVAFDGAQLDSTADLHPGQTASLWLRCGDVLDPVQKLKWCNPDALPDKTFIVNVLLTTVSDTHVTWEPEVPALPRVTSAENPDRVFDSTLNYPGNGSSDANGNIWMADTYNHRIVTFDPSGNLLSIIGSYGQAQGQTDYYPDDEAGICYDELGYELPECLEPSSITAQPGKFYWPGDVAVSPSGDVVVVADSNNHRIQVLTRLAPSAPDAPNVITASDAAHTRYRVNILGEWGWYAIVPGVGAGFLSFPNGVALIPLASCVNASEPASCYGIAISESDNNRVQIWMPATGSGDIGTPVATSDTSAVPYVGTYFGVGEDEAPFGFDRPLDVHYDAATNRILVADTYNNRIQVFDRSSLEPSQPAGERRPRLVTILGSPTGASGANLPNPGQTNGAEFEEPWALTTDATGNLFVGDSKNKRVQIFTPTATGYAFASSFGDATAVPGRLMMSSIGGIAVTPTGRLWVIEQDQARVLYLGATSLAIDTPSTNRLTITVTSGPEPSGDEVATVSFTVTNTGVVPLTDVRPQLTGNAVIDDLRRVDNESLEHVTLQPGASIAFAAQVSSTEVAPLHLTAAASGWAGPILVESPGIVAPEIAAGAGAMPAISISSISVPQLALLTDPLAVTVKIANTGSIDLSDVVVRVAPIAADGYDGRVEQTEQVHTIEQLSGGETSEFAVQFTPSHEGSLAFRATVVSSKAGTDSGPTAPAKTSTPVSISESIDRAAPAISQMVVGPSTWPQPCLYEPVPGGDDWRLTCPHPDGWFRLPPAQDEGVTLVLQAFDEDSGVDTIAFRSDRSNPGAGALDVANRTNETVTLGPVFGEGTTTIAFWATDASASHNPTDRPGLENGSPYVERDRNGNPTTTGSLAEFYAFCDRVPAQCVRINIDHEAPTLDDDAAIVSDTEAIVPFRARDAHSQVARVRLATQDIGKAELRFSSTSVTSGELVLTSEGPEVRGTVIVTDKAGLEAEFSLPFSGRPPLRVDHTPPEAFNRIDPYALGRRCSLSAPSTTPVSTPWGTVTPLTSYLCTNKVYGTDNLPGFPTSAFAPILVLPARWGGDYNHGNGENHDEHSGHHHDPDGHWDDDHDGYCDNHRGQRLTDDHRYGYTSHDKNHDGHHDKNCREPHDQTSHSGHWDDDHDGYCDNHPGVRFTDDHRYGYTSAHDRDHDGHHDSNCRERHDDDDRDDHAHPVGFALRESDSHGRSYAFTIHDKDRDGRHDWNCRESHDDDDDGYGGHGEDHDEHDRHGDDDHEHDWDGRTAEIHTYEFSDEYVPTEGVTPTQNPNRVRLVEKLRQDGNELRVRVLSYQYLTGGTAGPVIVPDWAYKKYEWSWNSDGSLKELNQKYEIGRGLDRVQVLANYDGRKNQTTITELGPSPRRKVTVIDGLVLLRMTTWQGTLKIEWDPTPVPRPDYVAPVLSVPSSYALEATSAAGATVTYTTTARDAVDPNVVPVCAPASGSILPLGSTTVTCTATDVAGNSASKSFTVTVRDTTRPVLSLPSPITQSTASKTGAAIEYAAPTATDAISGSRPVVCSKPSGSTFPLGTTTVSCSATDAAGNTATGAFTVTVTYLDTVAPVLTVPNNMTVTTNSANGTTVSFNTSAYDAVSGSRPVTCTPPSGSKFPVGSTTVSCSATDAAGNRATDSFTLTVKKNGW